MTKGYGNGLLVTRQRGLQATRRITKLPDVSDVPGHADVVVVGAGNAAMCAALAAQEHGVRFAPAYGRQAFKRDGRFRFWGGLTVEVVGGGPGLVESEHNAAIAAGIPIVYDARATSLVHDEDGVHGAKVRVGGGITTINAGAVVLACGGFQADPAWRAKYLGRDWDLAKVRGTRFNSGD